jgi:hypothetical protein
MQPRPYAPPAADTLSAHIQSIRTHAASLNADTRTDVRLGTDRANVTVLMLAAWGGRLRFQAHDPNEATAADLASDGKTYCMMDMHANCGECGPATAENVARLVRIPLEPDDVVAVLLGGAPLLAGATASVDWDAEHGRELLILRRGDLVEKIALDGTEQRWDVNAARLEKNGETLWALHHKDFHDVKTQDGGTVRLPGASLFEQGGDTVRIQWRQQRVGPPPDDASFRLNVPAGLPACQR